MKTICTACEKVYLEKNGVVRIKDVRCPHCNGIVRGYNTKLARTLKAFTWHHEVVRR